MTFEKIYQQVKGTFGWMPENDCRVLNEYVSRIKGRIVEIGSSGGTSMKVMALSSPESEFYSIDPYKSVWGGAYSPQEVKQMCINHMKGFNWRLIQEESQEVGKTWDKPIDFLHIDGDHRAEYLRKDIDLWIPHVRMGCYVFFHDYNVTGSDEEGGSVKAVVDGLKDNYFSELYADPERIGFAICKKKYKGF